MLPDLPAQPTPFVGREAELRDLKALLNQPDARLITILGPGGAGKTRLALAAVAGLEQADQQVFFVPLLALGSWEQVALAIAQSIGFKFYQNTAVHEQLAAYLHDKHILLLLDNAEHLLNDATFISDLLAAAPQVKLLITSREKLNLRGEVVFNVEGFEVAHWPTAEQAATADAVQLFLQSASRVQPRFVFSEAHLGGISRICERVGGLPLGIELAAAWVDMMSVDEIAAEIDQNYRFLETQFRDFPPRHRSMWATLNASWDHLTPEERDSLCKMSVFAGGFTRQAVQAVSGASLPTLQTLMNKSLLTRGDSPRYQIHGLLRQFAAEHLSPDERESARRAHSRYYLDWLKQQETRLKGGAQREALDEIELEFDNARAAWEYAVETSDVDGISRALESVFLFCMMRNRYLEGEALFAQAEAQFDNPRDEAAYAVYAGLKVRRVWVRRWREGSFTGQPDVIPQLEALLAFHRRTRHNAGAAICLIMLGDAMRTLDHNPAAVARYMQEGLEQFRALGDDFYAAWALHFMARHAVNTAGLPGAIDLQSQSLALRRQCGDLTGVIYALYNLSTDWLQLGDLERGDRMAEEMLDLSGQMGERSGELMAGTTLSLIACLRGDFDRAVSLAGQVLTLAADLNHPLGESYGVTVQGLAALVSGQTADGRTLLERANRIAAQERVRYFCHLGLAMAACEGDDADSLRDHLQAALDYAVTVRGTGITGWCLLVGAVWTYRQGNSHEAESLLALAGSYGAAGWLAGSYGAAGWLAGWPPLVALRRSLDVTVREGEVSADELEPAARSLLQRLAGGDASSLFPQAVLAANQRLVEPLSLRELEVLSLIAGGLQNQDIADRLFVGLSTVKKHISHIYGKLDVTTRTQAVLRAQEIGLV